MPMNVKFLTAALFLVFVSCQTIIVPDREVRERLKSNLSLKVKPSNVSLPEKLSLSKAKTIALKDNPGLQAAEQRILKARALLDQARALYFPSVKLSSGARHQHHVAESQYGFPTASYETYTTALSSQWLIFDGFAREYKVLAARYGESAARESFKDSQRLLADAVSQAFYRTILSQKEMEINLELKAINEKFLKDEKIRLDAGTSTKTQVNNFLVNVNNAEIAYLESKNSHQTAKLVLLELLGCPEADIQAFSAEYKSSVIHIPDYESALKKALNSRPDLKALQADILGTEAQLKEAEGSYYPRFYLEGSYGYSSFDRARYGDNNRDSYIGASMSWDLFTGNSSAALTAQRLAEKEEKLKTLKSRWFEIISQIRQQRQSLINVLEKSKIQKKTAELNKSIYEDTKVLYENGATSVTRVNEVLSNYSISGLNYILFELEALRRKEILDSLTGLNID